MAGDFELKTNRLTLTHTSKNKHKKRHAMDDKLDHIHKYKLNTGYKLCIRANNKL